MRIGGAFGGSPAVEDGDLGRAKADRGGRRIERGAAPTDDGDPAQRAIGRPTVDGVADQLEGVDDPVVVLALDAERLAVAQPGGHDHRVVPGDQLGRLDVAADRHPELEAGPGPLDFGHVAGHDLARQAPRDDAVVAQAAGPGVGVEDGHGDAVAAQLCRAGEPGRAGADDGDAGRYRRPRREERFAARRERVDGVALQASDRDGRVKLDPDAGAFAQALDRTGGGAGAAEGVGRQDRPGTALDVARGDLADEGRHIDARRAGSGAGGIETVEAAFRFGTGCLCAKCRQRQERVERPLDRNVEAHFSHPSCSSELGRRLVDRRAGAWWQ